MISINIYIFDIEVFQEDWIVVFKKPENDANYIVIHNDGYKLKEFLQQPNLVIGGFNNKHYDNWILISMIRHGTNYEIKKHSDFIIGGNAGWDYPFIKYKRLPCKTFDLRDDIADQQISLKAIEGNLKLPIVESSVPFDIKRKLLPDELEEVIKYCKYDVDSTIALYHARKDNYLDAKILVADMYNLASDEAIGLTNAKLSARVLNASQTKREDERNYILPNNIDESYIPKVALDFFYQIRDKSIPDFKLFGADGTKGLTLDVIYKTNYGSCPTTYAWGGVHGAKPCITVEEDENRVIINQDVASLYPNSMINFGYCSRSMQDPGAYEQLVKRRLGYKKAGNKQEANALKLVVNTVYGAMLNRYNPLADRWAGRSVCISNQLAMTVLIVQLGQSCKTIDFININTDGIMFSIDKSEVELSERIVNDWSEVTKFEMERDDFKKVIQKDVNNYIGIKHDGSFKTKGGYVSLYKGGNFKTNSLQVVDKAVCDYLVFGTPVEKTIKDCKDIFSFQMIVKTGSTYDKTFHEVNKKMVQVQKTNRVYAVKNTSFGQIYKFKLVTSKRKKNKDTGKMEEVNVDPPAEQYTVISECPSHAAIDNTNELSVDQLDLKYYIDIAKRRVGKYLNIDTKTKRKIEKITEVIDIMATKKTEAASNIYSKLLEARKQFLASGIKKTGINRFAEYKYFTLDEIIPVKQEIFRNLGLADIISFTDDAAILTITNSDNPEESIVFTSQLAPDESLIKNPIQKVGAVQTYVRRYLYMLALDIIESDGIEATTGKPVDAEGKATSTSKSTKPVSEDKRKELKETVTGDKAECTKAQKSSISKGLKKLRALYMDEDKKVTNEDLEAKLDPYIRQTMKKVKAGLNSEEADYLLVDIGNKIKESLKGE